MRYGELNKCTISDGPGVRVSLYVSGCCPNKCVNGNCPGCHNPEAQDFNYGEEFTEDTKKEILDALDHEYISGLSILGGEPFDNIQVLADLVVAVKKKYPEKSIWCYTGYELNDILRRLDLAAKIFMNTIDVVVVGPYIENQRDITTDNLWRGSRNQRVINMKETLKRNQPVVVANIPNND